MIIIVRIITYNSHNSSSQCEAGRVTCNNLARASGGRTQWQKLAFTALERSRRAIKARFIFLRHVATDSLSSFNITAWSAVSRCVKFGFPGYQQRISRALSSDISVGFQGSYTMYSLSSGERSRLALLVELLWVWLIGCCSGLEFLELLLWSCGRFWLPGRLEAWVGAGRALCWPAWLHLPPRSSCCCWPWWRRWRVPWSGSTGRRGRACWGRPAESLVGEGNLLVLDETILPLVQVLGWHHLAVEIIVDETQRFVWNTPYSWEHLLYLL